jgi:sugar/nucleoside kinase (ribokinase family)
MPETTAAFPEVLVVGEINPDLVVLGVTQLRFGQREDLVGPTTLTVGSSVAITACALSRLGTPTGIVGVIGDDAFGALVLVLLTARGVTVDQVRTIVGGRTGSSVILVRGEDSQDRQILTDPGVMSELRADDVDLGRAQGLRHLHVGSWFLHTGAVADFPQLLEHARRRGLSTSVDPNDDPARAWDSSLPRALPHVETLFCNEPEALGVATALGAPGPRDADEAARRLLACLPTGGTVVLKLGADGATAYTTGAVWHVSAPVVDVVDTIGAGDTLAAAFLHGRLAGQDVGDALRLAVAAGSLSTRRSGGVDGQPSTEQALSLASELPAHGPGAYRPTQTRQQKDVQ